MNFDKLLSGRFISTVVVLIVYAYCAIAGVIKTEFINEITLLILYAYFNKNRMPEKES